MTDLTALVDGLEMKRQGPKRWFLREAPSGLAWIADESLATRFPMERAEALVCIKSRDRLPLLPTDPPVIPVFVRAIYGSEAPPALSPLREPPQSAPASESPRLRQPGEPRRSRYRHVSSAEAYADLERKHLD